MSSRRRMICLINALTERLDADATHGIEKQLFLTLALAHIDVEDLADGIRDLLLRHRRSDDLAQRRGRLGGAAKGDLIPLLAVLVDAQDADMPDVMMAAGIHAS